MTYPAILLLENGRAFRGRGFGARVASHGEVVFNTSLTGYQEIVSDPSYCGQIVVMTAVEIGNVGVNAADAEAAAPVCAGLVVRERTGASSWRADDELDATSRRTASPASTISTPARSPGCCAPRARCAA